MMRFLKKKLFKSSSYWERRYKKGRTSGAGSYGRLAEFKAEIINDFVEKNNLQSVIEFGCGDGNQLKLANYASYLGVDVSEKALQLCKQAFGYDTTKNFIHTSQYEGQTADLSLSLDVIYHLVEDSVFEKHIRDLFSSARKFVIIYSSNSEQLSDAATHVRHRKFTDWISDNLKNAELIQHIPNKYPFDVKNAGETSFADFFIYAAG